MNAVAKQQDFFSIFDSTPTSNISIANPVEPTEPTEKPIFTFTTERQREIMRTNPFASFLRGKSLEEIGELSKTIGKDLYRKSNTAHGARRLELWRTAESSAQTIALELEYRKVDERFCLPENGVFFLIGKKGERTAVKYEYSPFYFDSTGNRTWLPTHHLEFRTENPTEISPTGYRSHFFNYVPYSYVKNFADFMVQTLRIHLKVTSKISFEGQDFEFDASILPEPKPKKTKCPECGEKFNADDECPVCGFLNEDDDFEDIFDEE